MNSTDSPEALKPAEVEFIQCLLDRYSEDGGIIDLGADHEGFMRIVRKHAAALSPPSPDRDAVIRECAAVLDKLDCSGNEDFSYGHDVALRKAEKAILALLDKPKPDQGDE